MMDKLRALALLPLLWVVASGCADSRDSWPPPPKNAKEQRLIDAAVGAVAQCDGWKELACVVERHEGKWRVQAWRIVNPQAKGRARCVPWAVRGVILDDDNHVVAYNNFL